MDANGPSTTELGIKEQDTAFLPKTNKTSQNLGNRLFEPIKRVAGVFQKSKRVPVTASAPYPIKFFIFNSKTPLRMYQVPNNFLMFQQQR